MAKKRKRLKKKYQHHSRKNTKHKESKAQLTIRDKAILAFISASDTAVSPADIHLSGCVSEVSKKEISESLQEMVRKGILVSTGKKSYTIDKKGKVYTGKIEKNPRGFGFVVDLEPQETARFFTRDPFLKIGNMASANHGDKVLIYITRVRKDGRPEAEILSILSRSTERLTGFYQPGIPSKVIPEDPRYPTSIHIAEGNDENIAQNDAVIVEILPRPAKQGLIQGKIIEILGPPDNIDVQMRLVIEHHNLPHIFPTEVLAEANALTITSDDSDSRVDLRQTMHVTIDGEDAKDFDDAIAIEKNNKGYRLYVSIADVSYFVKHDSPLDREAYRRGTSIYFPGRVIPMLPEKLSNELCSLLPGKDRLTFSAILDFDNKGNPTAKKFTKSIIRSAQRFTYTTVQQLLQKKHNQSQEDYQEYLPMFAAAKELAEHLLSNRLARGSIGFNIPEAKIALNENGSIETIQRKERNFTHQIIEEFMLAANEAVAEIFSSQSLDFLYRIHQKPDSEKVEEFYKFAQTLGLNLPEPTGEPGWFATVLDSVKSNPTEYVVNNLLLRTMQQARYDTENHGHFGLAATDYTHFTSPIRRYPDLVVHRLLHNYLQQQLTHPLNAKTSLPEQGNFLSSRERVAINAERDITERLKVFFMANCIGENFKAIISGVTETAIYVELINLFVSGVIEVASLKDDYYLFDLKRYRIIGEITGKTFQIGAQLEVTLVEVNHRYRRIYFAPTEE